jgi:methylglutaconyl-CoA hydratase
MEFSECNIGNNMNFLPKYETILIEQSGAVAKILLNRPEVHNALDNTLIDDLFDAFTRMKTEKSIRVIVISGVGKSFCAGADLNWMKGIVNNTYKENYEESLKLAHLMLTIYTHPKPIIAKVNGSAIGGGAGLISVTDIAIASSDAKFGFTEVSLGLTPAVISPFVIKRIGYAKAREIFITGEKLSAHRALEIGLVNQVCPSDKLDETVNEKINMILKNGPDAIRTVKEMLFIISHSKFPEISEITAEIITDLRLSVEGQEGMSAFLNKRHPNWFLE